MRNLVYDVRRYYHTVAPFLDVELAQRGDDGFWRQLGKEHAGGSILELGCGSGRVTKLLAEGGARVVGIDVCPELLDKARDTSLSRARGQPVSGQAVGSAQIVTMDMRELGFRTKFDLIVAADDPFSHLLRGVDRDRALAGVASVLARGGRFILDALWFGPEDERTAASPFLTMDRDLASGARRVHVTERWRCNPRSHRCSTEFDYDDGVHPPTRARFEARYWTLSELSRRLASARLQIVVRWGGFQRQLFDERHSKHLIIDARP